MPRNKYHDTPVVELHERFGQPVAWSPQIPPADRRRLRVMLIAEELCEFALASGFSLNIEATPEGTRIGAHPNDFDPNIVAAADGLGDLRVVVDGSNLEWGFPGEKILREIHRSNLSKLGPDGLPILRPDGKFLKGPNYSPPMLEEILELYKGVRNG